MKRMRTLPRWAFVLFVLIVASLAAVLVALLTTTIHQGDAGRQGESIGKDANSGSSTIVAYINGHPITAADIAEGRAEVAANLGRMRATIARIVPDWQPPPTLEGTPLAPGEFRVLSGDDVTISESSGMREFMEERIEIIEEHGVDAAILAAAVRDQALFTAATAAGHTADPADIAARIAGIKEALAAGRLPDFEAELAEIDENFFFDEVLPTRLARELAIGAWRVEVFADIYGSADTDLTWSEVEEEAISSAQVMITGEPGLEATLEDLAAYQEAYRIVNAPQAPMAECAGEPAVPNPETSGFLLSDCSGLLAVKDTLQGTGDLNWSLNTPMTRWDGVTIEDLANPDTSLEKRVTILDLSGLGLTGTIPTELSRLRALVELRLANNHLTGEVPASLWNLNKLETLWLHQNRLTGQIPGELGLLPNLESLKLSRNSLTGCIPSTLRDVLNHDLDSLGLPNCAGE